MLPSWDNLQVLRMQEDYDKNKVLSTKKFPSLSILKNIWLQNSDGYSLQL